MTARQTRRTFIGGVAAAGSVLPIAHAADNKRVTLRVDDTSAGKAISPFIYGSNELGTMEGGVLSATLDKAAGVTARRLGGNLMTSYNWTNNNDNSGKDWEHTSGDNLFRFLQIPKSRRLEPAAVISTMHQASLAQGAVSLVQVPLAGYLAADHNGPVTEAQAAPSNRYQPISWKRGLPDAAHQAGSAVVPMPKLIELMKAKFGTADSKRGIFGYALDNEAGLWPETHPRIVRKPVTIKDLIERSIEAATAIKEIDPSALVFGPCSWGIPEMVNFQNASDWPNYTQYGSFLGAYLAAFRKASDERGTRLLDVLDVHWYAYSKKDDLFRTEKPEMASALLDAPRSLSEVGFREDSWISEALSGAKPDGITMPFFPSLQRIIEKWYPGTRLSVSEFNFGGAGQVASGLAIADALGRFGQSGVYFATHWGLLNDMIGQAYRLFRMPDVAQESFGDYALPTTGLPEPSMTAYAARTGREGRIQVIVINKATTKQALNLELRSGRPHRLIDTIGFDETHRTTGHVNGIGDHHDGQWDLALPARSARRYVFEGEV